MTLSTFQTRESGEQAGFYCQTFRNSITIIAWLSKIGKSKEKTSVHVTKNFSTFQKSSLKHFT